MNKLASTLLAVATAFVCALPLSAQSKRASPHETVGAVIDGAHVSVVYGRPYSKDPKTGETRVIWGKLIPPDKVWRTGSDEATLLLTDKPITLGGTSIPAGVHTLYTFLAADGSAKLIVNKQVGQWGTVYTESEDFARIALTKETLPETTDQFTMAVAKNPGGIGGMIKLKWETTQYSVTISGPTPKATPPKPEAPKADAAAKP